MKVLLVGLMLTALGGGAVCVACEPNSAQGRAAANVSEARTADTATVRIHVSGMTCATCPITARKALEKLGGVYSAVVTYGDSLAIVKFDPSQVKTDEIATHLTKMTGYGARVLTDPPKPPTKGTT